MIPLRDNIQSRRWPVVTLTLITLNLLPFFYTFNLSEPALLTFIQTWAVIPTRLWASLTGPPEAAFPELFTPISAMFLHGGLLHLAGNMWFLWIFGDNIEDRLGHFRFLLFYFLCGLVATASELAINPESQLPMIGASGAVAGALGAYLRFYPKARVQALVPIFIFIQFIEVPAVLFLGLWFISQLLGLTSGGGGIAWFAHIFGFLTGLLIAFLVPRPQNLPRRAIPTRIVYRRR